MSEITKEKKKLEGAKFIHDGNKWFVRGDAQKLAAKPEVLRNLDQHRDFRPSTLMHERPHPAFVVVLSIVAVHFILAFMLLIQWAEAALAPHVAFTVLIGLACLLFGLLVVTSIKTVQRTRTAGLTTNDYLLALLRNGQHLPAQVIYTEPTFIGGQATRITYRFASPNRHEIQGEYTTSAKVKFQAGDKMVVLYLDDRVHVLL